jgi:hypothetical protein
LDLNKAFVNSIPAQKLLFFDRITLRELAKKKGIKKYYHMNKTILIEELAKIVIDEDFNDLKLKQVTPVIFF